MTTLIEYKVMNYVKIVYFCGSENEVIGDIPGGPYCFKSKATLGINDALIYWSDFFPLKNNVRVRFSGAYVSDRLSSVSFHATGIKCFQDPEKLYQEVLSLLYSKCGSKKSSKIFPYL